MEQLSLEGEVTPEGLGTAVECGRNALAFLEMALGHVPWHPSLALARMHLGISEYRGGEHKAARKLLGLCVEALEVTHGGGHALTRQAKALEGKLRITKS